MMGDFDNDFILINETYYNISLYNGSSNSSQNDSDTISIDIMSYPLAQVIFYIQYVTIFLLGIFGNCLVCYVVFRNKQMQTVTNYFIANLALSDILLCTFSVPFTPLYFFMREWVFGRILCHLVSWSQGVSVYVSTLTLTSIAIDRFFVIIYPFRPRLSLQACYFIIVCIWTFSLSATLPYALYMGQVKEKNGERFYCEEFWPTETIRRVYSSFTSVMQFVIPFIVIMYCYAKISMRMSERVKFKSGTKGSRKEEKERERKKRTNRMLIAMVTIFGISWLPFNLYHLVHDYYTPASNWSYTSLIFFITHVVAMSSTCYNTFLYAWLNDNFRKEFQLVLPCFNQTGSKLRKRSRSERTCNGSNEQTQLETLRDNVSSISPEEGRKRRLESFQTQSLLLPQYVVHSPPMSEATLLQEEVALTTFNGHSSSSSEEVCKTINGEANETL